MKSIYKHNWPLKSISQDYGLAFYSTYVVCVNFIRERRGLQFNVDFEQQISFWETISWRFYLLPEFLPEICWEEITEEIFLFFHTSFWCLTWYTKPGFTSNKPTHYLLDYGDFSEGRILWKLSGKTHMIMKKRAFGCATL